jgi:hypothetical protein
MLHFDNSNVIDPEVGQIRKSDTAARYFRALFEFLHDTLLLTIIMPTYSEEDLRTAVTAYRNSEYTSIRKCAYAFNISASTLSD